MSDKTMTAAQVENARTDLLDELPVFWAPTIHALCNTAKATIDIKVGNTEVPTGAWTCQRCGFVGFWEGGPHDCENANRVAIAKVTA